MAYCAWSWPPFTPPLWLQIGLSEGSMLCGQESSPGVTMCAHSTLPAMSRRLPDPEFFLLCAQESNPGVTVASFDTTEEKLEALAADLGVKGLPQFRFYKVRRAGAPFCSVIVGKS